MNKIFVMALAILFLSVNMVEAQEALAPEEIETQEVENSLFEKDVDLENAVSSTPVVGPGGIFVSAKELNMPQCHDKDFRQKIISMIENYQKNNEETTILGKRNQFLMLKKIVDFEEISPTDVDPKKDYAVANEIIETKINLGVENKDLRLCKCTKTVSGKDLYVFMYEKNNQIYGKIINFDTEGVNEEQLSFTEENI